MRARPRARAPDSRYRELIAYEIDRERDGRPSETTAETLREGREGPETVAAGEAYRRSESGEKRKRRALAAMIRR